MSQNSQQIAKITQKKYNKQESTLSLTYQSQYWTEILTKNNWTTLKHLLMSRCRIRDNNARILSEIELPDLQVLWLNNNQLSEKGIKQILKSTWNKLQVLKLSHNKIKNEGLYFLIKRQISILKILELNYCQIDYIGVSALTNQCLNNLTTLELNGNKIGFMGALLLTKIQMCSLQSIGLERTCLGSEGVKHLSKARWPKIKFVDVRNNKIGLSGYQYLTNNDWKNSSKIFLGSYHQDFGDYTISGVGLLTFITNISSSIICGKAQNPVHRRQILQMLQKKIQQPDSKHLISQIMQQQQYQQLSQEQLSQEHDSDQEQLSFNQNQDQQFNPDNFQQNDLKDIIASMQQQSHLHTSRGMEQSSELANRTQ